MNAKTIAIIAVVAILIVGGWLLKSAPKAEAATNTLVTSVSVASFETR